MRAPRLSGSAGQIGYDLHHSDGLRAVGVEVDGDALAVELGRFERLDDDHVVDMLYEPARLAQVRRRRPCAIERVRATGAFIEVCPTSNRRIAGTRDPGHYLVHRFLGCNLPVVISTDAPPDLRRYRFARARLGSAIAVAATICGERLVERAWRARA